MGNTTEITIFKGGEEIHSKEMGKSCPFTVYDEDAYFYVSGFLSATKAEHGDDYSYLVTDDYCSDEDVMNYEYLSMTEYELMDLEGNPHKIQSDSIENASFWRGYIEGGGSETIGYNNFLVGFGDYGYNFDILIVGGEYHIYKKTMKVQWWPKKETIYSHPIATQNAMAFR